MTVALKSWFVVGLDWLITTESITGGFGPGPGGAPLPGLSAISWPTFLPALAEVATLLPVAPAFACTTSAASLVTFSPFALAISRRSAMPAGWVSVRTPFIP